MAAEEKT